MTDLPVALRGDRVETSLDGVSVQLDPIFAPVPFPVGGLLAAATAGAVVWGTATGLLWVPMIFTLGAGSVNNDDLLSMAFFLAMFVGAAPGLLASLLALVPALIWDGRRPTGLDLELKAHQLVVRQRTARGVGDEVQVPLADLVDAAMVDGELVVDDGRERHTFVLPDRSPRTHQAVTALLAEHLQRGDEQRGEVPASLQRLIATRRGAERP